MRMVSKFIYHIFKPTLKCNVLHIHPSDVAWTNSSLTCIPSSIRQPERRKRKNSISSNLSLTAIVLSPLVGYGIETFIYSNITCEGVAVLSRRWSSIGSDLDRDGLNPWKEKKSSISIHQQYVHSSTIHSNHDTVLQSSRPKSTSIVPYMTLTQWRVKLQNTTVGLASGVAAHNS